MMAQTSPSVVAYFYDFFLAEKPIYKLVVFAVMACLIILFGGSVRRSIIFKWMRSHISLLLWTGFVAGCILRVLWSIWVPHLPDSEEVPMLQHAADIAAGKGFVQDGKPSLQRSVGYCVFLSIFYFFNHPQILVGFANALLSASVGLCLYLLGKEIRSPVMGLMAGYAWFFYPTAIFASNLVLDEHLCVPLMLLGLYYAIVHMRDPRTRFCVLSGLCLGVGALARPIPSVFFAAVFLAYWIGRFSFLVSVKKAALIGLIVFLCALPWVIRNWIQIGAPILYCNSYYGFYWANNSTYDVRFPVNPAPQEGEDSDVTQARSLFQAGGTGEGIYAQTTSRKAWEWIRNNPRLFLTKTAGKAFHLLGFGEEEWAVASNYARPLLGRSQPSAGVKKWLLVKSQNWFYVLTFLAALGGVGIFLFRWMRGEPNSPFLLMVLAAGQIFLMTVVYLAHLKYRYMLDPFFVIGCVYFVCHLPVKWLPVIGGQGYERERC